MNKIKLHIFSALFMTSLFSLSQTGREKYIADSIKAVLKTKIHDTTRCNLLNVLIEREANDEIWPSYNDEVGKIAERNLERGVSGLERKVFLKYLAVNLNNNGFLFDSRGQSQKALEYYTKTLAIMKDLGDWRGVAISYNNIGFIHDSWGNINRALEYYSEGLRISERMRNENEVALGLVNVGTIYLDMGDTANALNYFRRSLAIREKLQDKRGISNSLHIMGRTYFDYKQYNLALSYLEKSLGIREQLGDKAGIASSNNSLALLAKYQKRYKEALDFELKSLKGFEELEERGNVAGCYANLSDIYLRMKNSKSSIEYAMKAMEIAKEIGYPESIRDAANCLYKVNKSIGVYREALENFELYIKMRDSISNESTRKAGIKSQLKYDYEKQAAADSVSHAKESEVKNAQLAQQKAEISAKQNQQYALFGGLVLVIVFSGFMYNRFKVTQKQKIIIEQKEMETQNQNKIISRQKHEVEEKQKEILDSIHYAKRIQKALLPTEMVFEKSLNKLRKNS